MTVRNPTEQEKFDSIIKKYAWISVGHVRRVCGDSISADRIIFRLANERGWFVRKIATGVKKNRLTAIMFDPRITDEIFRENGKCFLGYRAKITEAQGWLENFGIKHDLEDALYPLIRAKQKRLWELQNGRKENS